MPEIETSTRPQIIDALCHTREGVFIVEVSRLSPEGCTAIAPYEWAEEFEFLTLTLAGSVEVNGRVLNLEGREAEIRFFGQIHPVVIDQWSKRAA